MWLMKKSILNKRGSGIQFLKFSLIGFLNTSLHYGIFFILLRFQGIHYLVASTIGYCVGMINSFILNKKWTFRTTEVRKDIEFVKFVLVNLAALLVNIGSLKYFVCIVDIRPEFGQIFGISLSMTTNFLGNKFWTFSHSGVN